MGTDLKDGEFMQMCEAAKEQSYDPYRQVGSVIVAIEGDVISTGTNRPPAALKLSREESDMAIKADPNWRYFVLEHAERNAIRAAGTRSLAGATIYSSLFPCADCARAIAAAGIARVVTVPVIGANDDKKWEEHFHYARIIFEKAGIEVDLLEA